MKFTKEISFQLFLFIIILILALTGIAETISPWLNSSLNGVIIYTIAGQVLYGGLISLIGFIIATLLSIILIISKFKEVKLSFDFWLFITGFAGFMGFFGVLIFAQEMEGFNSLPSNSTDIVMALGFLIFILSLVPMIKNNHRKRIKD